MFSALTAVHSINFSVHTALFHKRTDEELSEYIQSLVEVLSFNIKVKHSLRTNRETPSDK